MNRDEILDIYAQMDKDEMKDVLDFYCGKFEEIKDKLNSLSIDDLDAIYEARDIAEECRIKLY